MKSCIAVNFPLRTDILIICLTMGLFECILFGIYLLPVPEHLFPSLIWGHLFPSLVLGISAIVSSNTFSLTFSLSPLHSSLWCECWLLNVILEDIMITFIFLHLSFCCSDLVISIILNSRSFMHSPSFSLLFIPSSLFLFNLRYWIIFFYCIF